VEVDGDTKKDLLASPNTNNSENFQSLWYYHNASSTNTVNFQFVKKNFLQDEMIEVGQNSYPVLFDYNNDGKKDLLIGTYGFYMGTSAVARLTLYANTGTSSQPSYSLISKDYAGLSSHPNISCAMPTVGDIDGDGDQDICFGTSTGQIHWLENTAGSGNVCNFSVYHSNPFGFTTNSAMAAPQLFDLDGDGKLDLLIGTKNGRIAYYQNTGTTTSATFSLITNSLGGVQVTDDPNLFGYDGYATPFFYRESGAVKLLVGSVTGKIFQFSVPSNVLAGYNLISPMVNGYYEGGQSTVWYEDVNNDNKRDLFIGNASGGLSFFSSKSPVVGLNELNNEKLASTVSLFPNPANGNVNLRINGIEFETGQIEFFDLPGKMVLHRGLSSNTESVDISGLDKGIYFSRISLHTEGRQVDVVKKIIKD
jgi:hypothetical protein